jgi:hypothetical protein
VEKFLIDRALAAGSCGVVVHLLEAGRVLFNTQPGLRQAPITLGAISRFSRGIFGKELPQKQTSATLALGSKYIIGNARLVVKNVKF